MNISSQLPSFLFLPVVEQTATSLKTRHVLAAWILNFKLLTDCPLEGHDSTYVFMLAHAKNKPARRRQSCIYKEHDSTRTAWSYVRDFRYAMHYFEKQWKNLCKYEFLHTSSSNDGRFYFGTKKISIKCKPRIIWGSHGCENEDYRLQRVKSFAGKCLFADRVFILLFWQKQIIKVLEVSSLLFSIWIPGWLLIESHQPSTLCCSFCASSNVTACTTR